MKTLNNYTTKTVESATANAVDAKKACSVAQIREEYRQMDTEELPTFLMMYGSDSRSGVRSMVEAARKRYLKLEEEKARIEQLRKYEREYDNYQYICGIDEAGRGPLAGPVVAGAVILPKDCEILYINDSKKLSAARREELYDVIMEQAVAVGVGMASPERIDEINILQATYEAMREAVSQLTPQPQFLLNDAVTIPGIDLPQLPIIGGDGKSISIAAASIIAKVTRDRMMEVYDEKYPGYGFAVHKGYGTKEHIAALKSLGPSPIHRQTFIGHICL